MNPTKTLVIFAASVVISGCATVVNDASQQVKIETYTSDQQPVTDAQCVARNERGHWEVNSPGSVSVRRSGDNLMIKCEKAGYEPGTATAISRANGGMFGNILIGGGIGAIIDHNKGTAYTYPNWLRVILGQETVFDRKDEKEKGQPSPAVVIVPPKEVSASR